MFDGAKTGPYVESDPTGPLGAYGRTKLAGEEGVRDAGGRHVVLRTSWVYAAEGRNFVRTMLRLAKTRDRLGVVNGQIGHPTYAGFIAETVASIAAAMLSTPAAPSGVYHLAGEGACSWFDFATAIFEGSARRGGPVAAVDPIPTSAYPTPARRPANSVLSPEKLARDYGLRLPSWASGLDLCLDQIAAGGWKVD